MSDVEVTDYDPNDSPRSLRAVSPEGVAVWEQEVARLQHEVDAYNRQAAMFNSQGWKSLRPEIEEQLLLADQALRDDKVNTMTAVAFVRGQRRAFEFLLGLEQMIHLRRQHAQAQLQSLRSAEGPS